MLLKGRVAIITGGSTGIGRGTAIMFAEHGCDVVVADIAEAEGNKTIEEVIKKGRNGIFIRCDVTDGRQVQNMAIKTLEKFGKVDILVNNAGGVPELTSGALEDVSEEQWDKYIDLNLKSVFLCCKAVVPNMKKNRYGKIINVSSLGAIHPPASLVHYHSAKGGVLGFTINLAFELAPFNIFVNAILPGPVRTPFWEPVLKDVVNKESIFENIGKKEVPLQRVGVPEDVAGVALFLASDLSSFVTGECINVAGGLPLSPRNVDIS